MSKEVDRYHKANFISERVRCSSLFKKQLNCRGMVQAIVLSHFKVIKSKKKYFENIVMPK